MSEISFDFSERRFLVTGASSGIGYETAQELLQNGATVLCLSRHISTKKEAFAQFGERFAYADVDVTDTDAVNQALLKFTAQYGLLNGTVQAAGLTQMMPLQVWNCQRARQLMDLNLWACIGLLQAASKKKVAAPGASHVLISSVSAHRGQLGLLDYGASKAALEAAMRSAAIELARKKQRVNCVCLGWVEHTGMTESAETKVEAAPLRAGKTEDAAAAIQFLLSKGSDWITGTSLLADGGFLA